MQVYRYMDIGTAKATAEERERIPHHLIDIVDPDYPFSVEEYQRLARRAIEDIQPSGIACRCWWEEPACIFRR